MSWKLVTVHRIAHLGATISGTIAGGSSEFFATDLDIDKRVQCTASTSFQYDRSTNSSRGDANCLLLMRHNLQRAGATVKVYSDNSALGGIGQVKLAAVTPSSDGDYFASWSGTGMGYRYWRIDLSAACTVGLISLGHYFDLGEARLGGSNGSTSSASSGAGTPWGATFRRGTGRGSQTITKTFGRIATSTLKTIAQESADEFPQSGTAPNGIIDGIGGGGGSNPMALVDGDGVVFFGAASIDWNEYAPGFGEITVSITADTGGLIT